MARLVTVEVHPKSRENRTHSRSRESVAEAKRAGARVAPSSSEAWVPQECQAGSVGAAAAWALCCPPRLGGKLQPRPGTAPSLPLPSFTPGVPGKGHGTRQWTGTRSPPCRSHCPSSPQGVSGSQDPETPSGPLPRQVGCHCGHGWGGATGAKRSLPPHLQPRPHRPRPPGPLYLPEHPAWGPRGRGRAEGHSRTPKAAEGGLRGTSQDPWVSPNPRGCRAAPPGPVRAAAAPPTQESRLGWTRSGIQKPSF